MPFEKIVDKPKVSTWWWLLPIFLTAMGGILMFIALRKENYAVALKGLFLGFIIAGICIVIYVGIIGYEMYLIDQALEKELKMQEAIEEDFSYARYCGQQSGWTERNCLDEARDRLRSTLNYYGELNQYNSIINRYDALFCWYSSDYAQKDCD
jgi:hypothetical protein